MLIVLSYASLCISFFEPATNYEPSLQVLRPGSWSPFPYSDYGNWVLVSCSRGLGSSSGRYTATSTGSGTGARAATQLPSRACVGIQVRAGSGSGIHHSATALSLRRRVLQELAVLLLACLGGGETVGGPRQRRRQCDGDHAPQPTCAGRQQVQRQTKTVMSFESLRPVGRVCAPSKLKGIASTQRGPKASI